MYILDTNAIIYYFKGEIEVIRTLNSIFDQNISVYASTITEVELFGFSKLTQLEIEYINDILNTLLMISLDSNLARLAGSIRQRYNLEVPDSIIAATAIFTNSILVTRNTKDFKKIKELKILTI